MIRRLLFILILFTPTTAHALPTLDTYGGRMDVNCATTLPYFHVEQIGNKWWFCTPLGHGFIAMSVSIGTPPNPTLSPCTGGNNLFPIILAKYGDASFNWAWQSLKRLTHWGFNSIGEDSVATTHGDATCSSCLWPGHAQPIPLPYIVENKPAENASQNLSNIPGGPIKDAVVGTTSNWKGYRGAALYDVFDPTLAATWAAELASSINANIRNNDPWIVYILTDDSDFFSGAGATPDFITGHTSPNPAWTTLLTSPVQTVTVATNVGNKRLVYPTPMNFSKAQALNPVTLCSISAPCSLRDYLWQKYSGTIANLNAAWGSNYTTFDSSATQVTGESFGTGDGVTTTFTHTAAHGSIDPFSILISLGGTPQIGDCPWVRVGAPPPCIATTVNTGTLLSAPASLITQSTSTVNYSTGAITISFVAPPANGTAINFNYQYGGWMQGGTGLMDEHGSNTSWVGTNSWCLEVNPAYSQWTGCVNGGGGIGVPNANANFAADLDNWVSQLAAMYFQTMRNGLTAAGSHIPYFGLDDVGSFGAPAYWKFLIGEAPYVDGFFDGAFLQIQSSSIAEHDARYQYHTRYIGNKPFTMFTGVHSQVDSAYSCKPSGIIEYPNQAARGQAWTGLIQYMLTTPSFNSTIQYAGQNWWVWEDFQNENQGLVSLSDNAYDGTEATICSRPCDAYYTVNAGGACGGEQANYGDAITPTTAGNALWLQ